MCRTLMLALGALVLTACATPSLAQQPSPARTEEPAAHGLLDRMVGHWVLTGEIAGQATTHDVEVEWVLQHKYVRITEVSRERADNGLPQYEATIFVGWLETTNRYVCFWLDNTEVASGEVTCLALVAGDVIGFEFRDREGALIFTNRFTYDRAADTWQWRMVNPQGGREEVFGEVTLNRR